MYQVMRFTLHDVLQPICMQAFVNAPSVLIPPIHLGIVTYLIYLELGWTALLTIAFVVGYVLLQIVLGRLHTHWRYSYFLY